MHQRYKSHSPVGIDIDKNDNENYDGKKKDVLVNDTKLGALLYFSLIGIVVTSCLGDMHHRNDTMHREPNTSRALLSDCPVKDPDQVWVLLVCCYMVVVVSIAVLCHTMLGSTARSTKMRVRICRISLALFYCAFYNWDICMGTMPYLKKATTQVYFAAIIFFISSPTLTMPIIIQKSNSSKPPRWPLFLVKMMVFILYADSGWHKEYAGFSGSSLRAFLAHHWIFFERPMALVLLDYPLVTTASAYATLIFECFGWILVCFDYDRVAAAVALSFHIGIYVAMRIDFISFWCCSFVFFFVPSIASSRMFQRFLKRSGGEELVSAPLGRSLLTGIEGENKDVTSTDSVMDEDPKSKRNRKSSLILAVVYVLAFTYKGFYPYTLMLPGRQESASPSFLSILYQQLCGLTFKPFNSYTMYAEASFPIGDTVAFLKLKRKTPILTSQLAENEQRVKFIPKRGSDVYLYYNMLSKLNKANRDDEFKLDSLIDNTAAKRSVTRCNIFACLARQHVIGESAGDRTGDGHRGTLRDVENGNSWYIDSIELVDEWFGDSTTAKNNVNKQDVGEPFRAGSLLIHDDELCSIDITGDHLQGQSKKEAAKEGNRRQYDDGPCEDILAELDASARSVDASSSRNPFHVIPVRSRTAKHTNRRSKVSIDVPLWMVLVVMLVTGYKTYLLER